MSRDENGTYTQSSGGSVCGKTSTIGIEPCCSQEASHRDRPVVRRRDAVEEQATAAGGTPGLFRLVHGRDGIGTYLLRWGPVIAVRRQVRRRVCWTPCRIPAPQLPPLQQQRGATEGRCEGQGMGLAAPKKKGRDVAA